MALSEEDWKKIDELISSKIAGIEYKSRLNEIAIQSLLINATAEDMKEEIKEVKNKKLFNWRNKTK